MFNMLEKLINEHGSANILKERLGLKDDQITSLKHEFSSLTQEIADLKTENKDLNISLNQANNEIKRIQQIIEASTTSDGVEKLGDVELQIIHFLFENNSSFSAEELANIINQNANTTKYHLNNLLELDLLSRSMFVGAPATYRISNNGIKHVVESQNT